MNPTPQTPPHMQQGRGAEQPMTPEVDPTQTPTLLDDEIPTKFKDPKTGALKTDMLIKSYKELERKLSTRPDAQNIAPNTPEDYCIDCSHGLFDNDADVNQKLHAKGFSNDQAQAVYDLAAEKMVPAINALASDVQAERELEKLINHFGGADNWQQVAKQLLSFGAQNMPADVLDNLSSSYEGVVALYNMMKSKEPGLRTNGGTGGSGDAMNGADDLQTMMRDPKYWREKDPAFIAKVTEGFKKVYG